MKQEELAATQSKRPQPIPINNSNLSYFFSIKCVYILSYIAYDNDKTRHN
jgi:hypothetical protein